MVPSPTLKGGARCTCVRPWPRRNPTAENESCCGIASRLSRSHYWRVSRLLKLTRGERHGLCVVAQQKYSHSFIHSVIYLLLTLLRDGGLHCLYFCSDIRIVPFVNILMIGGFTVTPHSCGLTRVSTSDKDDSRNAGMEHL